MQPLRTLAPSPSLAESGGSGARQVLVLQDFRDMSGLAGGLSKLFMTFVSTGASQLSSFYFSDWGADRKGHYTHYHTQRLLYALAAILIALQLWFWLVYVPVKRCERARRGAQPRDELVEEPPGAATSRSDVGSSSEDDSLDAEFGV